MTKLHYFAAIARMINTQLNQARLDAQSDAIARLDALAENMAAFFATVDPRFNEKEFFATCRKPPYPPVKNRALADR